MAFGAVRLVDSDELVKSFSGLQRLLDQASWFDALLVIRDGVAASQKWFFPRSDCISVATVLRLSILAKSIISGRVVFDLRVCPDNGGACVLER